jgi:hypothetical protein
MCECLDNSPREFLGPRSRKLSNNSSPLFIYFIVDQFHVGRKCVVKDSHAIIPFKCPSNLAILSLVLLFLIRSQKNSRPLKIMSILMEMV